MRGAVCAGRAAVRIVPVRFARLPVTPYGLNISCIWRRGMRRCARSIALFSRPRCCLRGTRLLLRRGWLRSCARLGSRGSGVLCAALAAPYVFLRNMRSLPIIKSVIIIQHIYVYVQKRRFTYYNELIEPHCIVFLLKCFIFCTLGARRYGK